MQKAVFLDRDNTLIANDGDLGDPELVVVLDGAVEAVRRLDQLGFLPVVVTNQGGVARGHYAETDVDRVHERLHELLGRDLPISFYACPFHPKGSVPEYTREHPWRKPAPGMLLAAAQEHAIDLATSWMIGDQPRDAEAGRAAGCRTILVGPARLEGEADHRVETLSEAVEVIAGANP
ncbi:MAG: HAD family hydrolase [Phycisphaerales bacterium]|jgi:D-glycero-D-manno-heptose 1,7-bisphosphate phosphatase|nr:HAD family hydrolase [Phycisphaerales bacterium]